MNIVQSFVEVHIFRETSGSIEFLLLQRSANEIYPGIWQMITGHINENEKAHETALREVIEETGLIPHRMWVVPNVNHFYSAERDSVSLIPVFAVKLKENYQVIMCEEHCQCKWVSPEEAKLLLTWPGQKRSVDIITEYFTKSIDLLNMTEIKLNKS